MTAPVAATAAAADTTAKPERRAGLTVRGWTIVIAVGTAVFLELAPRVGLVDPFSVIPLSEMVVQLGKLLATGEFWTEALVPSLSAIALAFVLAIVLGVVVGIVLWEARPLRSVVEPWLTIYYAIPTFALYPLIVAVLGVGLLPIVLLGTMFAIVVVITSTLTGLDATSNTIVRLARSLQMSRFARATKILVPAALPHIVTGSRLALSYALIGVLASEFVLSTSGLGHFISRAYNDFAFADMYAGVLLVFVLAGVVNAVFAFVARRQPGVAQ
ncbi:ABC transporter permease subunit [Mycobacterium sp. 236(2023)]|uniref:ABC transporter permease n=1 Tax=Mycobacterium sp. 236(2023) TaxID=3038163 RepID=UPI0024150AC4|nr:ABC transporter permease subunit [Mycobacterium sp. 236(2023)]MDG4664860.1 ABC transporter permease subunit [Mycobacterium sp. 236(2023)]